MVVAAELLLRRRRRRRMRGRLISWCGSRPPRRPPLLRAVAATPVLLIPDLVCLALTATQTNERLPSSAAAPSPPPARPQSADPAASASAAARSYSIIAPGGTASSSAYPRPATAKERTPPWSRDTQPGDATRPPLAAAFRPGGKRTQGLGGGGQPQSVRGGGGPGGATARASTADGERLAGTSRLSF